MRSGGEQERGRCVPQVVEADGRQIGRVEQRLEVIDVKVGAPQRAAAGIAEDPGLFCKTIAHRLGPMFRQGGDDKQRQIDAPAALGSLRLGLGQLAVDRDQRTADIDCAALEVDVRTLLQPDEADLLHRDTYIADASVANNNFGLEGAYLSAPATSANRRRRCFRRSCGSISRSSSVQASRVPCSRSLRTVATYSRARRLRSINWTELGATWNVYNGANAWTTPGGDFNPVPAPSLFVPAVQNLVFDSGASTATTRPCSR